jgi:DNA-binding response OmpR family regulator
MAKILIVEDNRQEGDLLASMLTHEGYAVDLVHTGEDALQLFNTYAFDILILDWELPGISGPELCQRYRHSKGDALILMLTGRSDVMDKAQGLDCGADDYVTKPYKFVEVVARIRSLLRRPPGFVYHTLQGDGIEFEIETRIARIGDKKIELSVREAAVLEFLLRHPNRTYGARALLDAVWPLESAMSEDTVRSCMRHLRNKLATVKDSEIVKTVAGGGYMVAKTEKE